MESYILQLIEDLQAAHRVQDEELAGDAANLFEEDEGIEAHFAEVERYLSGEGHQKIAEITGLFPEQFPPVGKLTQNQMLRVVEAFDALLFSWHIRTDLPEGLPIEIAYPLMVSALDKEVFVSDGGFVTIEFCAYNTDYCPFGTEFCACSKFDDDFPDMDSYKPTDGELPF